MARTPMSIPDTRLLNWHPLPTDRDDNVPGPVWKLLTSDPQTGAITFLIHLPPGWHDDVLDWHPSTEEGFRLGSSVEGAANAGRYIYRQPGFLHLYTPSDDAVTIVQRLDRPLRILRYGGSKYPHRDGQAVTDEHEGWPIDQVRVQTETLPCEDAPATGPWAGTRVRWLHRNKRNGGGAVLMEIPAGWSGPGLTGRGPIEEFVVDGAVEVDGERYLKWGYACRAAGKPSGEYRADEGARLICWWDEGSELG